MNVSINPANMIIKGFNQEEIALFMADIGGVFRSERAGNALKTHVWFIESGSRLQ